MVLAPVPAARTADAMNRASTIYISSVFGSGQGKSPARDLAPRETDFNQQMRRRPYDIFEAGWNDDKPMGGSQPGIVTG
jgi:hypothetical protein